MSNFGRHNATGRSSGKLSKAERKYIGPPDGEPWAFMPRALLMSDAWRGMTSHCRKLIDFLLVDHANNAGRENGRLQATYNQLVVAGLGRKHISRAIREAENRGLIEVMVTGGLFGADARKTASRYRLTWIGTLNPHTQRTNEWKRFKKNRSRGPKGGTVDRPHQQRMAA